METQMRINKPIGSDATLGAKERKPIVRGQSATRQATIATNTRRINACSETMEVEIFPQACRVGSFALLSSGLCIFRANSFAACRAGGMRA